MTEKAPLVADQASGKWWRAVLTQARVQAAARLRLGAAQLHNGGMGAAQRVLRRESCRAKEVHCLACLSWPRSQCMGLTAARHRDHPDDASCRATACASGLATRAPTWRPPSTSLVPSLTRWGFFPDLFVLQSAPGGGMSVTAARNCHSMVSHSLTSAANFERSRKFQGGAGWRSGRAVLVPDRRPHAVS